MSDTTAELEAMLAESEEALHRIIDSVPAIERAAKVYAWEEGWMAAKERSASRAGSSSAEAARRVQELVPEDNPYI